MSDTATAPRALLAAPEKPSPPASELIVEVARKYGVSPFRQFGQMLRLWAGQNRMEFSQYYKNAIYRKELSRTEKGQFVGERGSLRLNNRLSPRLVTEHRALVHDKVLYGLTMERMGFPVPTIQAVASRLRYYGKLRTLTEASQIEEFLLNEARYPLFVKPEEGMGSVGSALITGIDRDSRELTLSNGTRIDLRAFASEVLEEYSEGFLFQDAVIQHPALSKVAGQAVGTIRVVTVAPTDSPEVLYTLWKVPSPTAMSDNYWQAGSMMAELDPATGIVRQCRRGAGPTQEVIETHPVSKASFAGMQIPHWDAVLKLATDAHRLVPQIGVLGWDIAVAEDGPLIIEGNANPHHMLFQLATGRGILNDDFAPILQRVEARAAKLVARARAETAEIWRGRH